MQRTTIDVVEINNSNGIIVSEAATQTSDLDHTYMNLICRIMNHIYYNHR
jgi:hypothetical protein